MTQLDLIDVGERFRLEHYGKYGRKKPPVTGDVIGSGPDGETCRTCLHAIRVSPGERSFYKCGLRRADWTHGGGSDIKLRWPACSKWEPAKLFEIVPEAFRALPDLWTPATMLVIADYWENLGETKNAARFRNRAEDLEKANA